MREEEVRRADSIGSFDHGEHLAFYSKIGSHWKVGAGERADLPNTGNGSPFFTQSKSQALICKVVLEQLLANGKYGRIPATSLQRSGQTIFT